MEMELASKFEEGKLGKEGRDREVKEMTFPQKHFEREQYSRIVEN